MALDRIVAMVLRVAELAFGAVVAALVGQYLHYNQGASSWDLGRFIYTEVVAAVAIFFSLVWLFPFSYSFIHWPVDIVISICWFVAFGLLVNLFGDSCGYIFNWGNVDPAGDSCGKWKAVMAFAFLSAICWLVSGLIGLFWVRDRTRVAAAPATTHTTRRRRWYRRSRV
jgi:hypothetical protein